LNTFSKLNFVVFCFYKSSFVCLVHAVLAEDTVTMETVIVAQNVK